jgi:hypothetical protein
MEGERDQDRKKGERHFSACVVTILTGLTSTMLTSHSKTTKMEWIKLNASRSK